MSKIISCGVIVSDTHSVLLGHVTGQNHWDIPKGLPKVGENHIDAAIRELQEETGILVEKSSVKELGVFAYSNKKNLFLLTYIVDKLPDIENMTCTSNFTLQINNATIELPEIDRFEYVDWNIINQYVKKSLFLVLSGVYKRYIV